jgi:hypothetical protein
MSASEMKRFLIEASWVFIRFSFRPSDYQLVIHMLGNFDAKRSPSQIPAANAACQTNLRLLKNYYLLPIYKLAEKLILSRGKKQISDIIHSAEIFDVSFW